MSKYLKKKDCAKILYDLYKDTFVNRIKVSTEITEEQEKRFSGCGITKEEIWVYDNKLIFLSDEQYLSRINEIRERNMAKQNFILAVSIPAYQSFLKIEERVIYTKVIEKFALESGFFEGLFHNEREYRNWLCFESELIREKDAEKIVENIKNFFVSRNC